MEIYIVTSGYIEEIEGIGYSEYSINGVFSTSANAQKYIEETPRLAWEEELRIEVHQLDPSAEQRAEVGELPEYAVKINLATGAVVTEHCTLSNESLPKEFAGHFHLTPESIFAVACSGASMEHARKLAVEKRQAWLRQRGMERWIGTPEKAETK